MSTRRLLLVAALLGASSCSPALVGSEWGADCADGKDNDGDGLIDCADPDCASSPACRDGSPDLGRPDQRAADRAVPDRPLAPPDTARPSSYGTRCTGLGTPCADNATVCVPGIGSPSDVGFCSKSCPTGTCRELAGSSVACLYSVNSIPYCVFLCRYEGVDFPCPDGMGCFDSNPPNSYQKYCWPR